MREWIRITMSDAKASKAGRKVSQRFAEVEDELRQGESLASLMAEQWRGMAGMAGMFIATIALAMYIRPYYDVGELHAFGSSGATQVRYVAIELVAIFAFTALIIFLAKWGKEFIIKYGMYAVLSMALLYTMVPLAHMVVLDFEPEPFEMTSTTALEGQLVGTWGQNGYILAEVSDDEINTTVNVTAWDVTNEYAAPIWTVNHDHNVYNPNAVVTMTTSRDVLTFASGDYAWVVDAESGALLDSYSCIEWTEDGPQSIPNLIGGCRVAIATGESVYLVNERSEIIRYQTFDDVPGLLVQEGGRWAMPGYDVRNGVIGSHLLKDNHWFLTTPSQAGAVLLEESGPPIGQGAGAQYNATYLYTMQTEAEANFTAMDVGYSPYLAEPFNDGTPNPEAEPLWLQQMVLLGQSKGQITGVEWNGSMSDETAFSVQDRMHLDGLVSTVTALRLTDLDESGYSDLLIAGEDDVHWLYTTSLIERGTFPLPEGSVEVFFAIGANQTELVAISSQEGVYTLQSGPLTTEMFPLYGLQLLLGPTLVGLALTVLLLILLWVHSEWYVVNTTGVLLGAGVCVMLGVTFVPVLAILFMVLAAIYDFWAVYRSKHMLDLADTMIGLRLPILLVAPQDSDYSLIEETEEHKRVLREDTAADASEPPRRRSRKKSEAMFMGLGDVIFPGMLVLSAMQWLEPSAAFQVAMSTLVGGLLGYFALMTYVARGKAQAGLPLLNGGAILGYLIGGMVFLGSEILSFNISW
jgi:presenilin-like A22 family membrane protease